VKHEDLMDRQCQDHDVDDDVWDGVPDKRLVAVQTIARRDALVPHPTQGVALKEDEEVDAQPPAHGQGSNDVRAIEDELGREHPSVQEQDGDLDESDQRYVDDLDGETAL
jgi:hypothetical protein